MEDLERYASPTLSGRIGGLTVEPFPDHRGRRRRRNGQNDGIAPAAADAGDFVMYVMDADARHCYGVYYDIEQGNDPTVYVNAITAERTLLY